MGYLLPGVKAVPRVIAADSSSTFLFIIKGNGTKNGSKMKFRVIPAIVDDEPDQIIETKFFRLFLNLM